MAYMIQPVGRLDGDGSRAARAGIGSGAAFQAIVAVAARQRVVARRVLEIIAAAAGDDVVVGAAAAPVIADTDVPNARGILMPVLRPFTLTLDGASYRISGALNLSAVMAPESLENSVAGA
jgi:hypothetical protein